jgi:UDP-N-acetylglucosamine/UDP-N-acetylgalactosamine 4-epimerase
MENIEPFINNSRFEFIRGDISNYETCLQACRDVDYVLHQAALGSVPRSVNDPLSSNTANVTGFINMLTAAKEKGVKRIVYASSSSVYGDSPFLPKIEDQTGNLLSPYAVTKKVNELYAGVFIRTYHMEIIGLRYFNIFGPRQRPDGPYAAAIPLFMSAVLRNEPPYINGDGLQSRDFTFVENAVEANIKSLFCNVENCNGSIFNVAVGDQTTINDLFDIIRDIAGSSLQPQYRDDRPGDIKHSLADIQKAASVMGYKPAIGIKKGLELTFNWFKQKYHPN